MIFLVRYLRKSKAEGNSSILMCSTCKGTTAGRSYNANEGENENVCCCKLEFLGFYFEGFSICKWDSFGEGGWKVS